jgi:hypothetical protein
MTVITVEISRAWTPAVSSTLGQGIGALIRNCEAEPPSDASEYPQRPGLRQPHTAFGRTRGLRAALLGSGFQPTPLPDFGLWTTVNPG